VSAPEADAGSAEPWIEEVEAWIDAGDWSRASRELDRARERLGEDEPMVLWLEGELALARWDLAGGRRAFERLLADAREAPVLENLALLADLEGDAAAADRLHAEAHALEPDAFPLPPRLDPDAFLEVVRAAAQELPDEFQHALEVVAVVIDPMPSAAVVGAPASGHPPDVLGLFVGPPLHEFGRDVGVEMPPTIFLFQRNLERSCHDLDELREEIRTTLYHELGHALGFDEDEVDGMGLG